MDKNIIKVILLISISSYGQVLMPDFYLKTSKTDYESLKGFPKEIFYETINKDSYKRNTEKKYYAFDGNKNLEKKGFWEFDSINNKIVLIDIRSNQKNESKENLVKNKEGKIISKIKYFNEGIFADSISEKKIYTYSPSNQGKKVVTYFGSIDTLDLGFEKLNFGKEIDPQYIEYKLNAWSEDHYNHKGQLIKSLDFFLERCYTYKYDSDGNIIEENEYRIHISCDNYHTDCNSSIPNCKEIYIHKFDNYKISENVWSDKINYEYRYDNRGNWIEKKVYNYDDIDDPLIKTITRKIIYE